MNCSEFERRFAESIESRAFVPDERAALAHHLEACPGEQCRQLWQHSELLAQAIGRWRKDVPQADLADRIVEELRDLEAAERARAAAPALQSRYALVQVPPSRFTGVSTGPKSGTWVALSTLAAALVLVLSVLTLSNPATRHMASTGGPTPTSAVAEVPLAPQSRAVDPAEGAPRGLSLSYSSVPLSATRFLTDAVVLVVPADLSEPGEEPSRADIWADKLEERWEPIGRELSSALDALLKAVPRTETAS